MKIAKLFIKTAQSLGAVHTHTHTHTHVVLQETRKRLFIIKREKILYFCRASFLRF